ncbi:MAG: HIT family protein [Acidimicrobiales bacterium]
MSLERLWAGWRMPYITGAAGQGAGPDPAQAPAAGPDPGVVPHPGTGLVSQPAPAPVGGPGEGSPIGEHPCPFCRILASGEPDSSTFVVWRGDRCVAVLNAYPYAAGHLMVMPARHVGELDALEGAEGTELWAGVTRAVSALRASYRPEGLNVGLNLGRAAGAGIPGHLHVHVVPRWNGDTNFMTTLASTRVLPEALPVTWGRVRSAWPG